MHFWPSLPVLVLSKLASIAVMTNRTRGNAVTVLLANGEASVPVLGRSDPLSEVNMSDVHVCVTKKQVVVGVSDGRL